MEIQPEYQQRYEQMDEEERIREAPKNTWECFSRALAGGIGAGVIYTIIGGIGGYFFGDAKLGAEIGLGAGFATGFSYVFLMSLGKLNEREAFERNRNKGIDFKVN